MSEKRMFLNPLITAQSSMTINVGYTWVYPFVKQHAHRLGLGDPWAHLVWECAVGLPTVLSFMRLRGPLQEKDEVQILSSQWQNSKPWNYHFSYIHLFEGLHPKNYTMVCLHVDSEMPVVAVVLIVVAIQWLWLLWFLSLLSNRIKLDKTRLNQTKPD